MIYEFLGNNSLVVSFAEMADLTTLSSILLPLLTYGYMANI